MSLQAYLPQDRLRALASNQPLPDRTMGSALFADISGFTTLTEALRNALGSRRGAEELTKRMESVYSTLISEIERHGGSVIGFAGDSMLCWFDEAGMGEQEVEKHHPLLPSLWHVDCHCSARCGCLPKLRYQINPRRR